VPQALDLGLYYHVQTSRWGAIVASKEAHSTQRVQEDHKDQHIVILYGYLYSAPHRRRLFDQRRSECNRRV